MCEGDQKDGHEEHPDILQEEYTNISHDAIHLNVINQFIILLYTLVISQDVTDVDQNDYPSDVR